jgi:hypothetical protein
MILDIILTLVAGPAVILFNQQHALEKLVQDPSYCVFSSLVGTVLGQPVDGGTTLADGGPTDRESTADELGQLVRTFHENFPIGLRNDVSVALLQVDHAYPKEVAVDPVTMKIKKIQLGIPGDQTVDGQVATLKGLCK